MINLIIMIIITIIKIMSPPNRQSIPTSVSAQLHVEPLNVVELSENAGYDNTEYDNAGYHTQHDNACQWVNSSSCQPFCQTILTEHSSCQTILSDHSDFPIQIHRVYQSINHRGTSNGMRLYSPVVVQGKVSSVRWAVYPMLSLRRQLLKN